MHTSCPAAAPDGPPSPPVSGLCHVCPESGLRIAWLQPPPALPVWPVCQQWQCADTHPLWSSAVTPGVGAQADVRSHTHVYILSGIFAVFSADKLDSLETPAWELYLQATACMHSNFSKYAHIFYSIALWMKPFFFNIKHKINRLI